MQQRATAVYVAARNRLRERLAMGQERGLTTTEIAVLTFILVGVAVAIGALIYNYARETVTTDLNEIETNVITNEVTD